MITITPSAAKQIRQSAKQNRMEGMPLRVAATRSGDGSIEYAMGFDDTSREQDTVFKSEDVDVVIAPTSLPVLNGTTIDFVELEEGQWEFIFMNPNDPNYQPAE